MKKKSILGLMLIFSLSFAFIGCGDSDSGDSSSDDATTKFEGTWNQQGGDHQFIFNNNEWLDKYDGTYEDRGTFIFTDTQLVIASTHYWDGTIWQPDDSWSFSVVFSYNFANNDTLVLSDCSFTGMNGTYTRQK